MAPTSQDVVKPFLRTELLGRATSNVNKQLQTQRNML